MYKGLPRTVRYKNVVGMYETGSALNRAYLDAIAKIETEVFFTQSPEENLPNLYIDNMMGRGYVRGPIETLILLNDGGVIAKTYKRSEMHVIRAFIDTVKAQRIVQYLPQGEFDPHVLLFHFLEKAYGEVVNNQLKMLYTKRPLSRDRIVHPTIVNSLRWIERNETRILSYL